MGFTGQNEFNNFTNWQTTNVGLVIGQDDDFVSFPLSFVPTSDEDVRGVSMCRPLTMTQISVYVDANGLGMDITFTMRKNKADFSPAQILTLTASVAGTYTLVTSLEYAILDLFSARIEFDDPAEGGTCNMRNSCVGGRIG